MDPTDPNSLSNLGRFQGRAYNDDANSFSTTRLFGIRKPKIALIWQFIGVKEFTFSASDAVVDPLYPFDFRVDLRDPPPAEVLEHPDLAVGTFWLYSDVNGNGKLDRLVHPELLAMNLVVDEMYGAFNQAMDRVIEVSDVKAKRVDTTETYYIGRYGTVVRMAEGIPDTIWTGVTSAGLDQEYWINILNNRFRVLNMANRWERFFALRKRDNDYFRIAKPVEGYALAYDFPYQRKLFPLPGKEREFEARVRTATRKLIDASFQYILMYREAIDRGWMDYPYDGFQEPGQDWVAGRTRGDCVLYIRNKAGMDEMLTAERSSSFSVTGKEKLHIGYNMIHCAMQYECRVMDPGDSIRIDLGSTEEFFNPRSTPLVHPIKEKKEIALPASLAERLQGAYFFQPGNPFCLVSEKGALWASVPDIGLFRLVPADSLLWFAPGMNLQLQVVTAPGGGIEKILLYNGSKRYVAATDPSLTIPDSLKARVRALAGFVRISVPAGRLSGFSGGYDYGGDTLEVDAAHGGDSLLISVPGMTPHHYYAVSESAFISPACDCRADFRSGASGATASIVFTKDGSVNWAPALAYVPRTPAELFPELKAEPDSEASASEGSGRDTYSGLDGKGRYGTGGDRLFLKSGDGWAVAVDHSLPGDSITLSRDGEGILFRVPGLSGKAAALEIGLRKGAGTAKGRVRFRLRSGSEANGTHKVLAEDFWVDFKSDSALVTLSPFPLTGDPCFLRLERVRTADAPIPVAFDGYRLKVSGADTAGAPAGVPAGTQVGKAVPEVHGQP